MQLKKKKSPYPNPYDYGNWRTCAGVPTAEEWIQANQSMGEDLKKFNNRQYYCGLTDLAWTICLYEKEVIDPSDAGKLCKAIIKVLESDEPGFGGEVSLIPLLDDDEDTGSLVNLGRTLQEPMKRLQVRDQILDFFPYLIELLSRVLKKAEEHVDTIMPAYTHSSQAQPTTYASYLLSIYESLSREYEQLALAYKHTNMNTGGCGSCSGTVWPVDRIRLTELLGMDAVVEPVFNCEAAQDHSISLLSAITNIMLTVNQAAMDLELWGMEELGFVKQDLAWAGVSSMMPQKAHQGGSNENIRVFTSQCIGDLTAAAAAAKGEAHGDTLLSLHTPDFAINALVRAKAGVRLYAGLVKDTHPQKEKMFECVQKGYFCLTEIVVYMIKELGYGGRRAHRVCAEMVRQARLDNVPQNELTGEMLDNAAKAVEEEPPGIDTKILRELLDPVEFIKTHNNIGGPEHSETMRMINNRKDMLKQMEEQVNELKQKKDAGIDLLFKKAQEISNECE